MAGIKSVAAQMISKWGTIFFIIIICIFNSMKIVYKGVDLTMS